MGTLHVRSLDTSTPAPGGSGTRCSHWMTTDTRERLQGEGGGDMQERETAAERRRPEEGSRCPTFMGQNRAASHCSIQRSWLENPCHWQSLLHTSKLVHLLHGFTSNVLFPPRLPLLCPNKTEETRPPRYLATSLLGTKE